MMVTAAVLAAVLALLAASGKLSHRIADRHVDRLYYASYALTVLSIALFVMQGLFGGRP
jgi:uncharacterized membrane protein